MKSRQEQAFDFVAKTFLQLIERDKRIEHKKEVLAFWYDFFDHAGIRNNMIQAFSNFLWEIDDRIDASRKAGIAQVKDAVSVEFNPNVEKLKTVSVAEVQALCDRLMKAEDEETETILEVEDLDLTEVGGGNEDDTPLI